MVRLLRNIFYPATIYPSPSYTPVIVPFRSVEKPGGGVVAFDDRMRNDAYNAYNYSRSLSATDSGGDWWLAALGGFVCETPRPASLRNP